VHRVAEAREQTKPGRAHGRVRIVHQNALEKRIDRPAQRGKRGHRAGKVLGDDGGSGAWLGGIKRGDEPDFGGFGSDKQRRIEPLP